MNQSPHSVPVATVTAAAVVAMATLGLVGCGGGSSGKVTIESIQPEFVTPVGADDSFTNVEVGFPWTEHGYCAGQFQAKATESATQVRVDAVISRTYSDGGCAGLGSNGKWATAPLSLQMPIGDRAVVRNRDGVELPVFALTVMLHCQDATGSQAGPAPDQTAVFNEVALPKDALQANRSGENDPAARLFAKSALAVAPGASFKLSVTDDWMGRLTIGWGSPAIRTMNLYVPGCGQANSARQWLVFPGGFWVDQPACVPVQVNSGAQQQTVQVGIGTACPGQAPPPAGT
jgi:hypothetical protein